MTDHTAPAPTTDAEPAPTTDAEHNGAGLRSYVGPEWLDYTRQRYEALTEQEGGPPNERYPDTTASAEATARRLLLENVTPEELARRRADREAALYAAVRCTLGDERWSSTDLLEMAAWLYDGTMPEVPEWARR